MLGRSAACRVMLPAEAGRLAVALALGWALVDRVAPASAAETEGPPAAKTGKREFNFFPILGGDSDVGLGGGQFSNWARLAQSENDFVWKVEDAVFVTFKIRGNDLIVPFIDVWAMWTVPHFGPEGRYRLELRPSFTDEATLKYYGIGNATPYPEGVPIEETEYRRTHPTLAGRLRTRVVDGLFLSVGSSFTVSWLGIPANSLLSRDAANGSAEVRGLLGKMKSNAVELLEAGVEYDTRDNETIARRGQHHALLARLSPAFGGFMPYQYLQVDASLRFYFSPVPRWLSISTRLVADAFLGDPPFYELARFDDTPAIGGGKAVRGVPAQRYHGKVKLFGNLEMRSDLWSFTAANKPFVIGVAAFVDAGRTWAELFQAHSGLDGTGLGLKYGVGTGIRFQEGRTFVVRADIAWSPDARPIGGYFDAGQLF